MRDYATSKLNCRDRSRYNGNRCSQRRLQHMDCSTCAIQKHRLGSWSTPLWDSMNKMLKTTGGMIGTVKPCWACRPSRWKVSIQSVVTPPNKLLRELWRNDTLAGPMTLIVLAPPNETNAKFRVWVKSCHPKWAPSSSSRMGKTLL